MVIAFLFVRLGLLRVDQRRTRGFGNLLTTPAVTSFVLFHRTTQRRSELQLALLLENLPHVETALSEGSVVVFTETAIRIGRLPILLWTSDRG